MHFIAILGFQVLALVWESRVRYYRSSSLSRILLDQQDEAVCIS